MEFVDGQSLEELLARQGHISQVLRFENIVLLPVCRRHPCKVCRSLHG
jgi:hypothetical protein